ncbi:MAG: hypothetical protein QOE73_29 [Verrucomicrobiota bacterium]
MQTTCNYPNRLNLLILTARGRCRSIFLRKNGVETGGLLVNKSVLIGPSGVEARVLTRLSDSLRLRIAALHQSGRFTGLAQTAHRLPSVRPHHGLPGEAI